MIIDLTMPLSNGMQVYEGDPEVSIELIHDYDTHTWQLRQLNMGSHTGTHVDAFSHMHEGKKTLSEIPLDRFMGLAQVFSKNDILESHIGLIFVDEMTITDAAKILSSKPNFVGGNIDVNLERELLKHEIVTYTNLINLDQLPLQQSFMFYGMPLNIKEGDGSPVRAIAII